MTELHIIRTSADLKPIPRHRDDFLVDGRVEPIETDHAILGLFGKYRDWSNFGRHGLTLDNLHFLCSEGAYMAEKTDDLEEKIALTTMTGKEAKEYGQTVKLKENWNDIRVSCMFRVVLAKFLQNPELAEQLLASGDKYIEETNWWNDTFWGRCGGVGENHLGRILMAVRSFIRGQSEEQAGYF